MSPEYQAVNGNAEDLYANPKRYTVRYYIDGEYQELETNSRDLAEHLSATKGGTFTTRG